MNIFTLVLKNKQGNLEIHEFTEREEAIGFADASEPYWATLYYPYFFGIYNPCSDNHITWNCDYTE